MKSFSQARWGLLVCSILAAAGAANSLAQQDATAGGDKPPGPTAAAAAGTEAKSAGLPWLSDLQEGYRRALADGKPVLVRAGTSYCRQCLKLAAEIQTPAVQTELKRWTLVYLDFDRSAEQAAALGIESTPALRILTARGRLVASQDGPLTADELIAWLEEHRQTSLAAPDDVVLGSGRPDAVAVVRLVRQFGNRNPAIREAVVRRLKPYREAAAAAVLKAFREGNLAVKLTALEVLREWKAPVDEMDPWRPATLTDERMAALEKWIETAAGQQPARPEKLSEEQLAAARQSLDRMLKAAPAEADAMVERLARLGPALLPEVYDRLKQAATDRHRQRLLVLRYRLVSSDSLVLRWPGGLVRLAATDPRQRQSAAEELARLAGQDDQRLLLELFSDPDPLVREISLRGLRHIGGREATAALVELLKDPEPNVRAAVLKQLAEDPAPEMVPMVAEYLKEEKDPDLVVHAIRFLRAAGGRQALKSLISLLQHESWQVRAEAAEAIGQGPALRTHGFGPFAEEPDELMVDGYVALIDLVEDPDAFVVSRAVEGLSGVDMAVAVEPLVKAAERHPDLASTIIEMLSSGGNMRPRAIPHLRKFCKHDNPVIRAAAVAGICQAAPDAMEEELAAGLQDAQSRVRIAAASALFGLLESERENADEDDPFAPDPFADPFAVEPSAGLISGAARLLSDLLKGTKPAETQADDRPDEPTPDEGTAKDQPAEDQPPEDQPREDEATPPKGDQPDTESEPPWDRWLKEYYGGNGRPKWADRMIPPLEKMLQAEAAEERLAAALALVPLGKGERALPVLIEAAGSGPGLVVRAGSVLPWLLAEERLRTFDQLRKLTAGQDDLAALIYTMVEVPDRRGAGLFWEMLADEGLPIQTAGVLQMGLRGAYLGTRYYSLSNASPSDRKDMVREAKARVTTGSTRQRLVALSLLASAAPGDAAELADRLAGDPKTDEALRLDAFQVAMATKPQTEAVEMAIAALSGDSDRRRTLALTYLAHGREALEYLRGGLPLDLSDTTPTWNRDQTGTPIIPLPPPRLKAEHLRPLLDSPDPKTAAYAGYLLALFTEPQGLDKLLEYRRAGEASRDRADWLVYRAIASLDEAAQVPVLEEIYRGLDRYDVSQFYWTIRIMSGPEILRLRKTIRDQVGMENLQ